jgi:hypothetical protein
VGSFCVQSGHPLAHRCRQQPQTQTRRGQVADHGALPAELRSFRSFWRRGRAYAVGGVASGGIGSVPGSACERAA